MKKLLAILLAAACAFSLAACAAAPDTPAAEEQPDCISDPTTQQLGRTGGGCHGAVSERSEVYSQQW